MTSGSGRALRIVSADLEEGRLGQVPVLDSYSGTSGNHPAILAGPGTPTIPGAGPPPRRHGHDPAWSEVVLRLAPSARVHSVHLPPGPAAAQLGQARRLASRAAGRIRGREGAMWN